MSNQSVTNADSVSAAKCFRILFQLISHYTLSSSQFRILHFMLHLFCSSFGDTWGVSFHGYPSLVSFSGTGEVQKSN